MANCVNINSSEFKDLKRQTNLSEKVLQAKVGVWQEKNGEENFPAKEDIYSNMSVPNRVGLFKKEISGLEKSLIAERISTYNKKNTPIKIYFTQLGQTDLYTWKDDERNIFLQKEGIENSSASPETIVALKDMLTRMGVDIHSVKDIVVDGIKQNANAVALLMQKVIQVVEGKETQSLPEEAMHFVTAIIKQTNPELYNQLLKEVNGYVITQQVFNDYGQDPNYQGKDGKPDIIKLKEEAIGKILAEYVINRTDGTNEKPELIAKAENWWSKIVDYLKSLFTKSGFDRASMDVVSGKDIGTADDINENNIFLQKKAEEHTADQIKEDFISKEKPNERKLNSITNLPENCRILQRTQFTDEYTDITDDIVFMGDSGRGSQSLQTGKNRDLSYYKGVLGRNAKDLLSTNKETTPTEEGIPSRTAAIRYSNLRVIQSLSNNLINNSILRKLELGEIRIVDNSSNTPNRALFVTKGVLYINEDALIEKLQDSLSKGVNLDEYIDVAVFEELIHLTATKLYNKTQLESAGEELQNTEDFNLVDKFYQDLNPQTSLFSKSNPYNLVNELIRMKVQKDLIGKSTEDINNQNFIDRITHKIWDFIISIFKDKLTKTNNIAENIKSFIQNKKDFNLNNDSNEILGLPPLHTEQDRIKNALLEGASKITPTPDGYTINGKKIANRVSDSVKAWYKAGFLEGRLTNDEFTASVNNLKAEKGTAGHADLEHALGILTDENHKLRENKLNDDDYVSQLNPNDKSMYVLLRDNLEERLKSFGDDAVFLSEIPLYDPKTDTAGTIDFVAITKEGKVSILDWKFMDLDTNKHDDIPWYKRGAWNLQMDMYKHMINSIYGVKNTDFEQTRMIPIKVIYSEGNNKENILPRLLRVKIGDVNIKNIDEDYLIPVGLANETTGNDRLDKLLSNLNGVYEKLSRETVTSANKNAKVEQLNTLFHAIRQLQMRGNVLPLLHQEKILSKKVKATIEEYNSTFKGKTKEEFPINSIVSAFTAKLEAMQAALEPYLTLNTDLSFLFEGELSPEDKELKNAIRDTVDDVLANKEQLKIIDNEYTVKIIGGSDTAEKVVRGLSRLFGTTATIQIKALDVLFKKANAAFHFAGMDIGGELKKLNEHKNNYQTWAKSKGLNLRNQFDIIKKKDSNELIDKYDSKFSIELKKNITDKDIPWIKDNIDVNAYKDYLEKKREEEYQRIEEKTPYRVGTEEQIASEIAREKSKISDIYNILSDKSPGWRLYDEIVQFPRDDKWISKEWIELNKPENTPAKAFYDYIRERNNYYSSIGYIREKAAETFLPWVRKSLSEKLIFGGDITLGEQFLRNISTDENEIGYGAIDPITKKPIDTVPKYLTGKIKGEVSTDLFKTMAMYNEFAIKFKYLTDIEAQARALIRLENNKNCLATSYFGRTERLESGAPKENSDNTENTKIVTAMVKAVVYQQRYIQSEAFDISLGKLGTFGKTLNDKLGYKIFPEDLSERQISLNKTITSFNNSFQINLLPYSFFKYLIHGEIFYL